MLSRLCFSAILKHYNQLIDAGHTQDYKMLLQVCEAEILQVTVNLFYIIEFFSSFYVDF